MDDFFQRLFGDAPNLFHKTAASSTAASSNSLEPYDLVEVWNIVSAWRGKAAVEIARAINNEIRDEAHKKERRLAKLLRKMTNLRYTYDYGQEDGPTIDLPNNWNVKDVENAVNKTGIGEARKGGEGSGRSR